MLENLPLLWFTYKRPAIYEQNIYMVLELEKKWE
jgi:hypothetical protein